MAYTLTDDGSRARTLSGVRRVVVKVGTRLLTDAGSATAAARVDLLVEAIARLRRRTREVILVTSGAIGAGMGILGTAKRPRSVPQLQAHAAIGQCRLMYLYETACAVHGFHSAQLLLTAADIQNRERHLNVTSCLAALLAKDVLPIINENDSVSVEEIRVGDNDTLAALVASMARADLTILLTTVDGMHMREPDGSLGPRLSVVSAIDEALRAMAGGTDGNRFSVGGMATKLKAADIVTRAGENLVIADGADFGILARILDGEDVGTLFAGRGNGRRMASHKRFLAFFSEPNGSLCVDEGAERAICQDGRSLLPGGIKAITGAFAKGDTVRIVNLADEEIARGVTNYDSRDAALIAGIRSADIGRRLGTEACYEEVVHRDYLVVTR